MRIVLAVLVALVAVGCDQRKPAMSDSEFNEFRAAWPGMTKQCLNEVRYLGIAAWRPNDPNCFEMLPPHRWSGLWQAGWEWSNFCPEPAKECDWMAKRGIWLDFAENAYHGRPAPDGVYRIDFVGRRTKVPANFGHQGSYDHLMVVDRVISIQKIESKK